MSARRAAAVVAAITLLFSACSDDDAASDQTSEESAGDGSSSTEPDAPLHTPTAEAETGGIDVPEMKGTFPVAVPSVGFGIAVPEGWQATLLTDEALQRLEQADLARPSFYDAAKQMAATGAVLYAAGIDDEGRVSELKVDVQDDADTSPEAMRDLAGSVANSDQVTDGVVVEDDPDDDRVRVDYRIALPSADDGETIDALGSQIFVADGDRLWSFIITSEDPDTQTALLQIFDATITFD